MKIDRLIGILSILLQQEKVTAPYLAEKFEVSRRTINRDIEDICRAGIPIVTTQGHCGGISIMEGYKIDRTLLTSSDMQAIQTGLQSLDSVSGTNRYQQLMEKLSAGKSGVLSSSGHILIDLSSWYKTSLAPKIELIQAAAQQKEKISFSYFSPKGESGRILEPCLLVFQWSSWYVWGYCVHRQDYRMFKLNRMLDLKNTGEKFEEREMPRFEIVPENVFPHKLVAKVLVEQGMKWRLIEEYGIESFSQRQDGKLLFEAGFTGVQSLFIWVLSFGDQAELLEPKELRKDFCEFARRILKRYE